MALGPRLELRQTQRLAMTPQLRQAISLLQMTNIELAAHLQDVVEQNPLLEIVDTPQVPEPVPAFTPSFNDVDQSFPTTPSHTDFDTFANVEVLPSLRDVLREQIQLSGRNPNRTRLALALVDELNEQGYVATPMFEITDRLGVSQGEVEDALTLLQACEPVGIGARDLPECLGLQLQEKGLLDGQMQIILDNLDLVAKRDLAALGKSAGLSESEVSAAITKIQNLNPKPVANFDFEPVQSAAPVVNIVKSADGGWSVELITESLPKVLLNETYAAEISKDGSSVTEYLTECRADAKFLIKAVDQRAKTILRVATVVTRHQNLFFDKGLSGLRPLTLQDVASELGIHESTVSRVTNGKYLYCPRGNFELRFFFVKGIARKDGGEDIAAPVIQEKIRALIGKELPDRVLSDENITKILHDSGIDVARRTVAKYREVMGIPSSSRRRQQRI